MRIKTCADLYKALINGPYAWPGGYPLYFVMGDGAALSFKAAKAEMKRLLDEIAAPSFSDRSWTPVVIEINEEDSGLVCCHTGEPIEAAYGSDGESP